MTSRSPSRDVCNESCERAGNQKCSNSDVGIFVLKFERRGGDSTPRTEWRRSFIHSHSPYYRTINVL